MDHIDDDHLWDEVNNAAIQAAQKTNDKIRKILARWGIDVDEYLSQSKSDSKSDSSPDGNDGMNATVGNGSKEHWISRK